MLWFTLAALASAQDGPSPEVLDAFHARRMYREGDARAVRIEYRVETVDYADPYKTTHAPRGHTAVLQEWGVLQGTQSLSAIRFAEVIGDPAHEATIRRQVGTARLAGATALLVGAAGLGLGGAALEGGPLDGWPAIPLLAGGSAVLGTGFGLSLHAGNRNRVRSQFTMDEVDQQVDRYNQALLDELDLTAEDVIQAARP